MNSPYLTAVQVIRTFSGHATSPTGAAPASQLALEACFTPDSSVVLSGGADGGIWRWETHTGKQLTTLREHHAPVGAIMCNPARVMVASADSAVCLWL